LRVAESWLHASSTLRTSENYRYAKFARFGARLASTQRPPSVRPHMPCQLRVECNVAAQEPTLCATHGFPLSRERRSGRTPSVAEIRKHNAQARVSACKSRTSICSEYCGAVASFPVSTCLVSSFSIDRQQAKNISTKAKGLTLYPTTTTPYDLAPDRALGLHPHTMLICVVLCEINRQRIIQPPSISMVWPVMKEDASEARKATRLPISSGLPRRLMDCCSRTQRL
jgi:hypothetical protein